MKIEAALTYDKIRHDQAKTAHLVVSLTAPAKEGGGFGNEGNAPASPYATDLVLELSGLAGHKIENVVSDVETNEMEVGSAVAIKIPEIFAEERRDIVLAIKLKAQKRAFPRPMNVFGCKLGYDVVSPRGRTERETIGATAKAVFVKPGEESPTPNQALDKIAVLAEIIRAQMAAHGKPTKGDLRRKMLLDLRAALERGDDDEALGFARHLVGLGNG